MSPSRRWTSALTAGLLLGLAALPHPVRADGAAPSRPSPEAVAARASEASASVTMLHERLAQAESRLVAVLRREASDLAESFQSAGEDEPLATGWMRLPTVVPDEARAETPPRSSTWSWPRIHGALTDHERALASFEAALLARASPATRKRMSPPELVRQHANLTADERSLAADVRHLSFWEEAERSRWPACLEQAQLHDLVVERASLASGDAGASAARVAEIDTRLAAARPRPQVPAFIAVERPDRTTVVLRVALATDTSPAFAALFERAAEGAWQARADGISYRVEIDVRLVTRGALVKRAKELHLGKQAVPRAGEPVDLERHVSLFPPRCAVLTSGATTTHSLVGRYVALGPQDISRRVLAHEFGHVLGFLDGYFRGCRDDGAGGLAVLEVVSDASDIMDHPTQGFVTAAHFQALLREIEAHP